MDNPKTIDAGLCSPAPACSVCIRRDLFEWLVEYALDAQSANEWKRNGLARHKEEMDRMDAIVKEALIIRDTPNIKGQTRPSA
jgi:hypothetical protein